MSTTVITVMAVRMNKHARVEMGKKPARKLKPRCCWEPSRCTNKLAYIIDGRFFCGRHAEHFWNSGHFVEDHQVKRINIHMVKA